MNFFSKVFGNNKDYVNKINSSIYSEKIPLNNKELHYYNKSLTILNEALRDYNSYYLKEYKQEPMDKNYLEFATFIWAIIQEIFKIKGLSDKVEVVLFLSIKSQYISLSQVIRSNGYDNYEDFFLDRVDSYNVLIEKLVKSPDSRWHISSIFNDIINLRPLIYIQDKNPLNMPNIAGTDAYITARFYDFISMQLVTTIKHTDQRIN